MASYFQLESEAWSLRNRLQTRIDFCLMGYDDKYQTFEKRQKLERCFNRAYERFMRRAGFSS